MFFSNVFSSLFNQVNKPKPKILFIVKQRCLPHYDMVGKHVSTGLKNSAAFVSEMLTLSQHYESKVVEVIDNNCIDREVNQYTPDVVIIEALWVVPEKFEVLRKLHPTVKWIIRLHSETPFLAGEGNAMDWVHKCSQFDNVFIGLNSDRIHSEFGPLLHVDNVLLLPNYYPTTRELPPIKRQTNGEIHIGCFGAVRPMKNHLLQAIAAIHFANDKRQKLFFHINGNRCEGNGDPVLKNLRALFANHNHELIEHPWLDHAEFLEVLKEMDISSQVSLSETFNIVTADAVNLNIPVVTSAEIAWVNPLFSVRVPTSCLSIKNAFERAWAGRLLRLHHLNFWGLQEYNENSEELWELELSKVLKSGKEERHQ
jgi:hypothetical protein